MQESLDGAGATADVGATDQIVKDLTGNYEALQRANADLDRLDLVRDIVFQRERNGKSSEYAPRHIKDALEVSCSVWYSCCM